MTPTKPQLRHALVRASQFGGGWPAVVAFFVVVTCLWFAPLIVDLGTHVLVGPSDATNGIRGYWAIREAGETPWTFRHDALNGAPEGYPQQAAVEFVQPIQSAFIVVVSHVVGLVAALNLFILLGFVGTGVAGYALGSRLGFGAIPSLLLGYVVAFNPWMFRRAFDGHLTFVQGWVLILVVIACLSLIERRTIRSGLMLGAALGLAFWVAAYFGFFASLPVALALAFVFATERLWADRLWAATLACATALVTGLMLLPGVVAYLGERGRVNRGLDNPLEQLQSNGAAVGSYLLPSEDNPVLGWVARRFLEGSLGERLVYFGYSTMALAAVAVVLLLRRRGRFTPRQRRALQFAAVLVPLAIVCSMPRLVHVGGVAIPAPAYLGGEITSFYRFYVRFGYIAGIGMAVLAAGALSVVLRRRSYWLAASAVAICVVELIPGPITTWNAMNPPDYVRWLAQQPRGIVAHYPLYTDKRPAIDLSHREHYNQRFHGQPHYTIFGGGYGLTREHAIRVFTRYVTDPATPNVLAAEHVRYVVLHDDVYRAQQEAPPQLGEPNFVHLATFGDARIFRVTAAPAELERLLFENAASIGLTQGLAEGDISFESGFVTSPSSGDARMSGTSAAMTITNDGMGRFFELRVRLASVEPTTVSLVDEGGRTIGTANVAADAETMLKARLELGSGRATVRVRSTAAGVVFRGVQAAPLADVTTRLNPDAR